MWNDSDMIMRVYEKACERSTRFPCLCPVCQKNSAHVYIHRHNEEHCGIWTWCHECGASAHMSGKTPVWWVNPDFVNSSRLCSDPTYLNGMANKIDEWVNSFVSTETAEKKDSFVMEHKFNVVLKEEIEGIPAGTPGIMVIRDDFRTVKVDFIGTDGKTVCINETPEKIAQAVEVQ